MAMYPEVCTRMREEVLQTHGHDQVPTYESLRGLKYSECAVPYRTLICFPFCISFRPNSPVFFRVDDSGSLPFTLSGAYNLCVDLFPFGSGVMTYTWVIIELECSPV